MHPPMVGCPVFSLQKIGSLSLSPSLSPSLSADSVQLDARNIFG